MVVLCFDKQQSDLGSQLDKADKCIVREYPNYQQIDKVSQFFKGVFPVRCYVNKEARSTIILTEGFLSLEKFHYLQCCIPVALPWYFKDAGSALSEQEMRLLRSLREDTPDNYLVAINGIGADIDFATLYTKTLLTGFETLYEKRLLEIKEAENESHNNEMSRLRQQMFGILGMIKNNQSVIYGLKLKTADPNTNSEILEYFLHNKRFSPAELSDTRLTYIVSDYLVYFDKELVKNALQNPRSYIYIVRRISHEDIKALINAIFIDEILKIKCCAAYSIDLMGSFVPHKAYSFTDKFSDYLPNPHINRYGCLGNYELVIADLMAEFNYVGVLEQSLASCRSLNFADSTVMEYFIKAIDQSLPQHKFIEMPDGTAVSPFEAIELLKENKAEE
jgi:hypothetical protein